MQLTVLVQSCFEAATVLRIRRDALARRPLTSIGMQVSCKPKIVAGEKLTRILARRLLQRSLAGGSKSVRPQNKSLLGLKTHPPRVIQTS